MRGQPDRVTDLETALLDMIALAERGKCPGPCTSGAWCYRCRSVAEAFGVLIPGTVQFSAIREDNARRRKLACKGCRCYPCAGITASCAPDARRISQSV